MRISSLNNYDKTLANLYIIYDDLNALLIFSFLLPSASSLKGLYAFGEWLIPAKYAHSAIDKSLTSLSTSKDDTKTLKAIDNTTDALKESADTLLSNGSNSVFRKVSKTDEKGNVTNEYDKDKIYGAVKQFVDDYNDVVDSVGKSNTSSIQSNAKAMYYLTQANKALLSSVGIGVDTDGKLSVNEESFKKADMSTVKSLFHGAGSYGYQVSAKASLINYNVETENKRANTYTNSGTYAYNYSQGNFYNDVF